MVFCVLKAANIGSMMIYSLTSLSKYKDSKYATHGVHSYKYTATSI